MLTINRRDGERIFLMIPGLSHRIEITSRLSSRCRGKVFLDIEAPPEVKIYREEVWERELMRRQEEETV